MLECVWPHGKREGVSDRTAFQRFDNGEDEDVRETDRAPGLGVRSTVLKDWSLLEPSIT